MNSFGISNGTGAVSSEVVTTKPGLVKSVSGAYLYDGCLDGMEEAGNISLHII